MNLKMFYFKKIVHKSSIVDDNDGNIKKRLSGQRDLEMNHSHYLMLDDGTLRFYDIEDFRTRLCVQLAKLQQEDEFPSKYIGCFPNKVTFLLSVFCSSCCYYCC